MSSREEAGNWCTEVLVSARCMTYLSTGTGKRAGCIDRDVDCFIFLQRSRKKGPSLSQDGAEVLEVE